MRVFVLSEEGFFVAETGSSTGPLGVSGLLVLVLALAMLLLSPARADTVPDLYTAQVTVSDRSAAALEEGAKEALSIVLVKISGSAQLLRSEEVVAALARARSRVQKYAYLSGAVEEDGHAVRFEFGANYVTDLVRQSGAPLWTANRPPVLAWVVIEDATGRHLFRRDRYPELAQQLSGAFAGRGVVLQLPLFDLQDATAVRADDLWNRKKPVLLAASERYGVSDVAVARIRISDAGEVSGDWVYYFADEKRLTSSIAETLPLFWRRGADLVADNMAARYAVVPTTTEVVALYMTISGVYEYADYAGIVSWLDSLEPIAYANLERVQGDTLTLRLGSRAQAQSLSAIIELNEQFVPVHSPEFSRDLSYRWQN